MLLRELENIHTYHHTTLDLRVQPLAISTEHDGRCEMTRFWTTAMGEVYSTRFGEAAQT